MDTCNPTLTQTRTELQRKQNSKVECSSLLGVAGLEVSRAYPEIDNVAYCTENRALGLSLVCTEVSEMFFPNQWGTPAAAWSWARLVSGDRVLAGLGLRLKIPQNLNKVRQARPNIVV
jgi:hypothetical protein